MTATPYEIWITAADGEEYPLVSFFDELGLNDLQAQAAAVDKLQDIIDKINSPGSDTVVVKKGLVSPYTAHLRQWRRENDLES